MFRRFRESPYAKAAGILLICGALLIMFHRWISDIHFSVGFDNLNKTLAPFYIGGIFAFVLCPVYNACVKEAYKRLLEAASRKAFPIGAMSEYDEGPREVGKDEKRRILTLARACASLVCVIIVVGIVSLFIYFVVPQIVASGINLANTLPERLETLSTWLETHFARFPQLAVWVDNVANAGNEEIIRWIQQHILTGNAMSIATMISNGVVAAVKYVANAFIGLLIMVYLLNYKERLFAIVRKLINATCTQSRKASLYEFADILNETFIGFIVGRIIDSFIIGVLTYIVLKICSIPFALMISVIVGVTNVIPFFGPFIGAIPSVLILMLEEPVEALYFIIIVIVIQQIDGNIIGPKIVGNAIGISSFWVLVAVLIGGGLFGFPGMALGVPVFAVIYRYVDKLTMASLRHKDKDTHTSYYFSLEPFGIEDDEIELEPEKKSQSSIFSRFRKKNTRKINKYIYDGKKKTAKVVRESEEIRGLIDNEQDKNN